MAGRSCRHAFEEWNQCVEHCVKQMQTAVEHGRHSIDRISWPSKKTVKRTVEDSFNVCALAALPPRL